MSAYLTSPEKIGTLAQAIAARTDQGDATAIANTLAAENLRSVAWRYRTDANGAARKFMGMSEGNYRRLARIAATCLDHDPAQMSEAALLHIAGEYQYQSCECNDWPETKAARLLAVLTEPVTASVNWR